MHTPAGILNVNYLVRQAHPPPIGERGGKPAVNLNLKKMRRAAKVDDNQPQIVKALRRSGAYVILTSQLKNAFDLLVIYQGVIYIVEVKDGSKTKSRRQLTEGEEICRHGVESHGAKYHIIESVDDALKMIGV